MGGSAYRPSRRAVPLRSTPVFLAMMLTVGLGLPTPATASATTGAAPASLVSTASTGGGNPQGWYGTYTARWTYTAPGETVDDSQTWYFNGPNTPVLADINFEWIRSAISDTCSQSRPFRSTGRTSLYETAWR